VTDQQERQFPPGARILVRDEEWLVRNAKYVGPDGWMIKAIGVSEFVQDESATFFDQVDRVEVLRPEDTKLVDDDSPRFRRSRLFLEAVLRRTPLPQSERRLALADGFLLDRLGYQQRPAELALAGLRPRILLADVVGLGKTLEIGLTLAELIRRGRGERILVVTPAHVLEQFQHELWTRFAIPLVRLDSVGISRIHQEIPAGRNPFTFFKRVIISIDTLKDVGAYGHHLETIEWDAVVIDESHNLISRTSLRNQLARQLSGRTDALLLASATPHNGDKRSFAELIRLLDPAAIADPDNYSAADIEHLYLRRTKISPEVRDQIGDQWADRGPSVPIHCPATLAEEKIFEELTQIWLGRDDRGGHDRQDRHGDAPVSRERRLFPYTLLKSFLSSHRALRETIGNRLGNSDGDERVALLRLHELADAMSDQDSAKLAELLRQLTEIGVGPGAETRVVVFSERVATLKWLAEVVPTRLGFAGKAATEAVRVLHGGLTDTEQQDVVKDFSLQDSSVRLLFTGDVASEGVNLHRQCHHLIHYDLPWSLIRIEQRNGRIDRYGQRHQPQFRALILTSQVPGAKDDTSVAEKLLAREEEAHRSLGSVEAVTGEYLPDREERRLIQDLLAGKSVEESLAAGPEPDVLADLLAEVGAAPPSQQPAHAPKRTLFTSTEAFVEEVLREVFGSPEDRLNLRHEASLLAFDAPDDLEHRLADLPRPYLNALRTDDRKLRLKLTFDRDLAERKLEEARKRKQNKEGGLQAAAWPDIAYLSDIHPVVEWLVDKVLVRLGRQEAPVLLAAVNAPVFLVQGVYCNRLGQPTVVEWMAVSGLPDSPVIHQMKDILDDAGVGPQMANPNRAVPLDDLEKLIPAAIDAARVHLERQRFDWDDRIAEPLNSYRQRLERWEQRSLLTDEMIAPQRARMKHKVAATAKEQRDLVDLLETAGDPLLRLLAVLEAA